MVLLFMLTSGVAQINANDQSEELERIYFKTDMQTPFSYTSSLDNTKVTIQAMNFGIEDNPENSPCFFD
ncbi:MAG: hypothetical protein ACOCU6_03410 [Nanoarchaeota archaeon]